MKTLLEPEAIGAFSRDARAAIYECVALRRDVRHFKAGAELSEEVLLRILQAAHQAPSVGFSQPWAFIVVQDGEKRARVRDSFLKCRAAEAARFPPERREAYLAHKLEGIVESSINLCVAVDLRDRGEAVLGTTAQPEALRASACCAVQNLWLAARAEGVGVGWVSIVEPQVLRRELRLPPGVEPIAYLCLGEPIAFRKRPMLEETGWQERAPLAAVLHLGGVFERRTRSGIAPEPPEAARGPEGSVRNDVAQPSAAVELSAVPRVEVVSEPAALAARDYSKQLAKPSGSLGRLEQLAEQYAAAHGVFPAPPLERATLLLFAADHGVVVEGVSAYGSDLTAAVVMNVMSGGAAVCALAGEARVGIELYDVGVASDLSTAPRAPCIALHSAKVRAGTGNLCRERAMSAAETRAALQVGTGAARAAIEAGARALGLGEIGIGNTTAAAALTSVFTGLAPDMTVGPGTGISVETQLEKCRVVERALSLHRPSPKDPLGALAALGGLELAALAGAMLEAARLRTPVVLDGYITTAAALVACRLEPTLKGYLMASHASAEPGARAALAELGLSPLFDLGLRLGEGTGACLGLSLLRSAVLVHGNMATFATAGIVDRAGLWRHD